MCCTQLSCGPWQPKGPFIKDIQRYPKSRKMRTRGRGCLVNLDILFFRSWTRANCGTSISSLWCFLTLQEVLRRISGCDLLCGLPPCNCGWRACMFFFNGGGVTDKRTSAGLGGSKESRKMWTRGRGSKIPQILRTSFMNGPQSDLSEDDCPENYYYYYSSQWDDLSLLPRLQEQTSSLIGYGLPH